MKPVLEGDLMLEPLKNMLVLTKKEAKRWLGLLEMGCVQNGAAEIEGLVENNLKEKKGKEVVLSKEEEDLVMG
jgi:hypothetical protein